MRPQCAKHCGHSMLRRNRGQYSSGSTAVTANVYIKFNSSVICVHNAQSVVDAAQQAPPRLISIRYSESQSAWGHTLGRRKPAHGLTRIIHEQHGTKHVKKRFIYEWN